MNSNYIFTKRLMDIDGKVLITMLVALLLSTGFLGYSIIKTTKEVPCKPFDILIFGQKNAANKIYPVDEQIIFRVSTNINDKVIWNFGDGFTEVEGAGTRHIFAKGKIFSVTATINGKCQSGIKINIKKREAVVTDSSGNISEPIQGVSEALVAEPVTFKTPIDATSYRWSIDRSGYPIQTTKEVLFSFKTSGVYTIRLIVNNDRTKDYKFMVNVTAPKKLIDNNDQIVIPPSIQNEKNLPVEKENVPDEVQPPKIAGTPTPPLVSDKVFTSDENLEDYLQSLLCGKTTLQSLEPFFCDLNSTKVTVTEEKKVINTTLSNLCASLNCKRNIRILSINEVTRKDKCVTSFLINIEKTKQKKVCPDN